MCGFSKHAEQTLQSDEYLLTTLSTDPSSAGNGYRQVCYRQIFYRQKLAITDGYGFLLTDMDVCNTRFSCSGGTLLTKLVISV